MKRLLILIVLIVGVHYSLNAQESSTVDIGQSENGTLVPLWNHKFGEIWYHVYPVAPSPTLADLGFGSDHLEVISGNEEYYAKWPAPIPGEWYCFNSQGSILWTKNTSNDEARTSPVVADIDGDGDLEIGGSTTSGNQLQMMNHQGDFLWRYKVDGYYNNPSSPALCDVFKQTGESGTPLLEMVAGSLNGIIYCLDADPSDGIDDGVTDFYQQYFYDGLQQNIDLLWKFDTKTVPGIETSAARIFSSPAVGDLDGDGTVEIVFGNQPITSDGPAGRVFCLNGSDGTLRWHFTTGNSVISSAALADVDGDNKLEVLIGSNDARLYCLESDGTKKWSFQAAGSVRSSPTVADLDGDGQYEVIFGSDDNKIYCLNAKDGVVKWTVQTNGDVVSSPTPANRTGKRLDIFVCSDDGFLYIINGVTGAIIERFYAGAWIQSSPSVADIDGDGHLEVLFMDWAADNGDYQGDTLWCLRDMGSDVDNYEVEWPMFRGNACHTGLYNKSFPGNPSVLPELTALADPDEGDAPLTCTMSMIVTSAKPISKYEWDFDGDGDYDWSSPTAGDATTTFTMVGNFKATARITDSLGQIVIDSVEIKVHKNLSPPVASITSDVVTGDVPLTVYLSGTATDDDGTILLYEWDFDGDGNYDWSSTEGGQVSHIFTEAETHQAKFRVTDNDNLSDCKSIMITVLAAKQPPIILAVADPNEGDQPLDVVLTGVGDDPDGQIVLWEWDYDGDGDYDWSSPTSGITQHLYTEVGVHHAVLRATDNDGLTTKASAQIVVTSGNKFKVWISKPKSGDKVCGSAVSIRAQTAPGASATDYVLLQWKKQGDVQWIDLSEVEPSPYSFFDDTWDTSALAEGQIVDLRAVAFHIDGVTVATSDIVTVTKSCVDPDVSETIVPGKGHEKKEKVSKNKDNLVVVDGGTSVAVPYGTLDSDTHLDVLVKESNDFPINKGSHGVEGAFVSIHLENVGSFNMPLTITLPYKDDDNDGNEDSTGVPVTSLKMHSFNPSTGLWEVLDANSVDTNAHLVTAQTPHLSDFGLLGSFPSSGSGGSGAAAAVSSAVGGGLAGGGGGGGGPCLISSPLNLSSNYLKAVLIMLSCLAMIYVLQKHDGRIFSRILKFFFYCLAFALMIMTFFQFDDPEPSDPPDDFTIAERSDFDRPEIKHHNPATLKAPSAADTVSSNIDADKSTAITSPHNLNQKRREFQQHMRTQYGRNISKLGLSKQLELEKLIHVAKHEGVRK